MVVCIIGLLAAVALPAYQDYVVRARLSEAMLLAVPVKKAVEDYYVRTGLHPRDNAVMELPPAEQYQGHYVAGIRVEDGGVHIMLRGDKMLGERVLSFTPYVIPEYPYKIAHWNCGSRTPAGKTTVEPQYLPSYCK